MRTLLQILFHIRRIWRVVRRCVIDNELPNYFCDGSENYIANICTVSRQLNINAKSALLVKNKISDCGLVDAKEAHLRDPQRIRSYRIEMEGPK